MSNPVARVSSPPAETSMSATSQLSAAALEQLHAPIFLTDDELRGTWTGTRWQRVQAVADRLPKDLRPRFLDECRRDLPPWQIAPGVIENVPPCE